MATQWHPLFARLLGLLLEEHYTIETEVPVSDLPRRGDFLIVRRQGANPPFQGLWSHLTEWNVLEFKGPTDAAEEEDLEKLVHVGTGLTYRFNEEHGANNPDRMTNGQVSFWYLAPTLGETFLGHARLRTALDYQTGGLWRGLAWGHPIWLVSSRDVPVETDTIPLHLLDRQLPAPRSLGDLIVQQPGLLARYAGRLNTLQPELWKEIQTMADTTGIIDWEAVVKVTDPAHLAALIQVIPPADVIRSLGVKKAIEVIGAEKVVDELLTQMSAEQLQELLRQRQQQSNG